MKVIIITNQISNNITNKNHGVTNIMPMTLTDGRICIGADILDDLSFSKYADDISNLPVIDIDELLLPERKLIWLLNRDGNGPLMPEDYDKWMKFYKKEI